MSSPMMTRMLGFCGCCAVAGVPAVNAAAVKASTPGQIFFAKPIIHSWWNFRIQRNRAAGPFGPVAFSLVLQSRPVVRLVAAARSFGLFDLLQHLVEVVARRV